MPYLPSPSDFFISTSSGSSLMASMHYHDYYELYYLRVGRRDYFIEDKLFPVSAGEFILIPPGKLHRTGGEYGERVLIGFTEEFLARVYTPETRKDLLQCFESWKRTPSSNQQERYIDLLKKLQAHTDKTEAALQLGVLLLELQRCSSEEIEADSVSAILSYINKNYGNIENLDDIAENFFVSKYHLCRIFKNALQMTVIDYLNQIRIKNACQMLTFSHKPIQEISELCGYHATAYFSSVFRQVMGKSPSEYRKDTRSSR